MRKTVQFVLLFTLIASGFSLSATVLERPIPTPEFATTASTPTTDFGVDSLARDFRFRPESVSFTLDRPSVTSRFVSEGGMLVNLERPQFFSRVQNGPSANAPVPSPEPGSLALLASGLLSGAYFIRRRK